MTTVPDFDDLPRVKDMPQGMAHWRESSGERWTKTDSLPCDWTGCAWGVFDKPDGRKDIDGTLNHITRDVVRAAGAECRDGVSVSLNWPIGALKTPGFGRKGLVHKVTSFFDSPLAAHGYDDEIEFNTQCSSQWDSLCHFHHQGAAAGYNGVQTSVRELTQEHGHEDTERKLPTLNHWHARGGLVTRGVFIDFRRYAGESARAARVAVGLNAHAQGQRRVAGASIRSPTMSSPWQISKPSRRSRASSSAQET